MDLTDLWVLFKTRRELFGLIIVGTLLFGAGWHTGRVMSPYYAASPIIFEEAAPYDARAAQQALQQLSDEGVAARAPESAARVAGTQQPAPTQSVTVAAPEAVVGEGSAMRLFVGSRNSSLYHHHTCSSANRIKPENQIWWPSKEAAEAAGYTPSKCTLDKL